MATKPFWDSLFGGDNTAGLFADVADKFNPLSSTPDRKAAEAALAAKDAARGPAPTYEGRNTGVLGGTGVLNEQYQYKPTDLTAGKDYGQLGMTSNIGELDTRLGANPLDTEGYEANKAYGLRDPSKEGSENSAWGQMMLGKQGLEETAQRNLSAADLAGQQAQGRSAIASRGGLSGSAGERMATAGGRESMLRGQDIAGQGAMGRANINIQDELNRVGAMQNLPGMALANRASQQADVNAWQQMANTEQGRQLTADEANRTFAYGQDTASSALQNQASQLNTERALAEEQAIAADKLKQHEIDAAGYWSGYAADRAEPEGKGLFGKLGINM